MNNSTSYSELNNEQLLFINILNTMYNDNIRQINIYNESINLVNQNNTQIRNLLFQIFNNSNNNNSNNNNSNNNNSNNINSNNINSNNQYTSISNRNNLETNTLRNSNSNNLGRIMLNNIPYIIENIEEFRFPLRREGMETTNNNLSQLINNFFQPIEVFPTPTQIEISTRIVRYSDIISPRNRSCPISLENFNDSDLVTIIRFCGHIFNSEELNTWFRSNCRCPVCRYDIRTFNEIPSSDVLGSNSTNINENENENIERNEETNNINRNNSNYSSLINRLLNSYMTQDNGINLFTDLSGNLLNNESNYEALIRLLNSVNNNYTS